jgi:cell division protein FtsW (lipid II flippase)/cell division protein FtsI/penicillin-binding protein 2
MAVTKSWQTKVVEPAETAGKASPASRRVDLAWLLAASLMVAAGLALVYLAKTQNFTEVEKQLERGDVLNLNSVGGADQLQPFLQVFSDPSERELAAQKVYAYMTSHAPLPNVGALARIRVSQTEIQSNPTYYLVRSQLQQQLKQQQGKPRRGEFRLALLPLAKVKPLFVVRTPREYQRQFALWVAVYFAGFLFVFMVWKWMRFQGDATLLPALLLLSGVGFILSVSLRDPLRDTLEFSKFAWGAAAGCAVLLLPSVRLFHYQRFSKWCYTPLFLAFGLFILLLRFGSGPTGNDAKVNLGPFQPVEIIKVLIVFFMAGYFARNWERLRDLREKRLLPGPLKRMDLPRASHALPVMFAVGCALLLFFLMKDLGPALVTGFLFLALFAIARGRVGLAVLGVSLLVSGVYAGYKIGKPPTVVDRISMWLSPWDNDVRGGDQLAHSLWAFATGGVWGSGPGLGDPGMIPAGHTDLVLPSIGEEWGFIGVATVFLLFGFLVRRSLRIALKAPTEYGLFLALGLTSLIAFEMLLISAGVLGAIPLSGVVSPFLSSGNTAMLANFLIFGILLAISNHEPEPHLDIDEPFRKPVRLFAVALAVAGAALLAKASSFQVFHDQELIARDTRAFEDDGVKRAQHNPRINSLAREIQRGTIYDRNGIPLATSDWGELERHRADYEKLGVSIDQACSRMESRHYPFGPETVHLLGDLRTGENFHASNASLVERDSNVKLQGFADYRELAPLVRFRHDRSNHALQLLKARDRSVQASIDIRLQLRADEILRKRLAKAGRDKGALVVMNSSTGDVFALVSEPEPAPPAAGLAGSQATPDELLDRARYGQYPPGSTFKLVTAIAALRTDPQLAMKRYNCQGTGDGRVGTRIPGWRKVIHDDIGDSAHGTLMMERAIVVSCNAYFAQLGVYNVGPEALSQTAKLLEIPAGEVGDLRATMPFAAYGQGPVLVTPFKMARVAATIAAGGEMPQGRWVTDGSNSRVAAPREVLAPQLAAFLAGAMRGVVVQGTARRAMRGVSVSVAGKTGTAQVEEGAPHSWFAGFAPYEGDRAKSIAFAIVVEHGGYGGQTSAPIAKELVDAAKELGIIQ